MTAKGFPVLFVTIPGRVMVLKNSKRVIFRGPRRRASVLPSPQYSKWERHAANWLRLSFKGHLIDWPCEAHFKFYFQNRQGEADVSNLIEGPADVLQKVGILKDDKLIMRVVAEKFFGSEPRCEISFYRYDLCEKS